MNLRTIPEAAKELGISDQVLRRGIKSGRYPSVEVGTRQLVDLDDVAKLMSTEKQLVSIAEASAQTGMTANALRKGIRDGWIKAKRMDRKSWGIDMEQLTAALVARKKGGNADDRMDDKA